jgi:hypothetical protein
VSDIYRERQLARKFRLQLELRTGSDVTTSTSSFIFQRVYGEDYALVADIITDGVECSTATLTTLKHFPDMELRKPILIRPLHISLRMKSPGALQIFYPLKPV